MNYAETMLFLKEVFVNIVENMDVKDEVYETYFSKDYIQHVDGKTLNFEQFVAHMKVLKTVMNSIKVNFKFILVDNDKAATLHIVEGIKKNGESIKVQVNAFFKIKDRKIIVCDELTHLI